MRRVVLCFAVLGALGVGGALWSAAHGAAPGLQVTRGTAKYGSSSADGGARHSVRLVAALPTASPVNSIAEGSEVQVRLGEESLIDVVPGAEGTRIRMRGTRSWRARVRGKAGGVGVRKLKVDLFRRRLVVRVKKANLATLRDGALKDLPLTMNVGDATAETDCSFRVRSGSSPERWDLEFTSVGGGGGGNTGGGGGGGDPGGGTATQLSTRVLASGMHTGVQGRSTRVARTQTEWNQLWNQHEWPGSNPPPSVDFSREMVLAVFRGMPTVARKPGEGYTGVSVTCVRTTGSNLLVTWEEVPNVPISCSPTSFAPCIGPSAFQMVAVERSTLPTQFFHMPPGTGCDHPTTSELPTPR